VWAYNLEIEPNGQKASKKPTHKCRSPTQCRLPIKKSQSSVSQTKNHLTMASSHPTSQHKCKICGSEFKNDSALCQHFAHSRMCLTEDEMRRPTLDLVTTNSKKKRRSFGPGTTEQRKANKQEAEKRVVIQDTLTMTHRWIFYHPGSTWTKTM
jgi:hypothetical protein